MKKCKKKTMAVVLLLIVGCTIGVGVRYSILHTKKHDNNNHMAIYVPNDNGEGYQLSNYQKIPKGYKLNVEETNAHCSDGLTASWDDTTKTVSINATKSGGCNLYLDKEPVSGAQTLIEKANAASVTTYSSGNTAEMYTFTHSDINTTLAIQVASWTSNELTDYRYIGANPNNYVYFNCTNTSDTSTCEKWRIIGVFTVEDKDGNKAQRIKLIRNATIGNLAWNSSNVNEWVGGSLATILNSGDYYTRSGSYATNGLTASAKSMINEKAKYYLGGFNGGTIPASTYYNFERGTTVYSGRSTNAIHEVGIMYPSDFAYTYANGIDSMCFEETSSCEDGSPKKGWIYNSNKAEGSSTNINVWSISPRSDYNNMVYDIYDAMYADGMDYVNALKGIRPVVYLNSDVTLDTTQGDGSETNPYILKG